MKKNYALNYYAPTFPLDKGLEAIGEISFILWYLYEKLYFRIATPVFQFFILQECAKGNDVY